MSPIARWPSIPPRTASRRSWPAAASVAARIVADRPALWLSGGLGWAATAAPVALLVAVVPAPRMSDLTFIGSRAFSSSAWPWNLVALGVLGGLLVLLALALVTLSEAGLRRDTAALAPANLGRSFAATLISALPALVVAAGVALLASVIAPDEFVAPEPGPGGPLFGTLLALAPLLALLLVTAVAGGAYATAARVAVANHGAGVGRALVLAGPLLRRAGVAGVVQAATSSAARLAYLAGAILLLGVLWAPIGAELAAGAQFDAPLGALLVGFVAVWLCLVLGGGALHAWGSIAWTRILSVPPPNAHVGPADTEEAPSIS